MVNFLTVSRIIPRDALLGLVSGAYTLRGGVVRDMAGRIVAHLATPAASSAFSIVPGLGWIADAFQSYKLQQLGLELKQVQGKLDQLLTLSTATLTVSGLGLAVSVASLGILSHKLGKIQAALSRLEQAAKKTNHLIEAMHYGQLQAAIDGLILANSTSQNQTRHDALMCARRDFGQLLHAYQHLWPKVDSPEELAVLDDAFTVAMVGHSLTLSELQESSTAETEFARHRQQWRAMARTWCDDHALRDDPHRLLDHRFVKSLPMPDLVRLLDFVRGDDKGLGRLDELRQAEGDASVFRLPRRDSEDALMAVAKQLAHKDEVLDAYQAHFEYLAAHRLSASAFAKQVADQTPIDVPAGSPLWVYPTPIAPTREASEQLILADGNSPIQHATEGSPDVAPVGLWRRMLAALRIAS